MVALAKDQRQAMARACCDANLLNICQGLRAIDFWLAGAQQVQIGAVENVNGFDHGVVTRFYPPQRTREPTLSRAPPHAVARPSAPIAMSAMTMVVAVPVPISAVITHRRRNHHRRNVIDRPRRAVHGWGVHHRRWGVVHRWWCVIHRGGITYPQRHTRRSYANRPVHVTARLRTADTRQQGQRQAGGCGDGKPRAMLGHENLLQQGAGHPRLTNRWCFHNAPDPKKDGMNKCSGCF